jgi:hypothetical protein
MHISADLVALLLLVGITGFFLRRGTGLTGQEPAKSPHWSTSGLTNDLLG